MTREEYFGRDILDKIEMAIKAIAYPNEGDDFFGHEDRDFLVWSDEGCGIHVTDVLHNAWIAIKRLRGNMQIDITRFEIIDHRSKTLNPGRTVIVSHTENAVMEISIQDEGRTLKVFINDRHL